MSRQPLQERKKPDLPRDPATSFSIFRVAANRAGRGSSKRLSPPITPSDDGQAGGLPFPTSRLRGGSRSGGCRRSFRFGGSRLCGSVGSRFLGGCSSLSRSTCRGTAATWRRRAASGRRTSRRRSTFYRGAGRRGTGRRRAARPGTAVPKQKAAVPRRAAGHRGAGHRGAGRRGAGRRGAGRRGAGRWGTGVHTEEASVCIIRRHHQNPEHRGKSHDADHTRAIHSRILQLNRYRSIKGFVTAPSLSL